MPPVISTDLDLLHRITVFQKLIVTQHIEGYQLSEDWILSYGDAKSKYLNFPKSILRFHMLWNLQYLIFKVTWRVWCKNSVFMYKLTSELQKYQFFAQFPKFLRVLFSKSTFHQSVMISSIKLPYLKNTVSDFKNFCTKIEMKEWPFRKYQRVNFYLRRQLVPFDMLRHNLF